MTGCNLLDFGKPARQNGKRLPCERLMDENAKLRKDIDRLIQAIEDLHVQFDSTIDWLDIEYRMRELGVDA